MRTIEEQNKILDSYLPLWNGYQYLGENMHAFTQLGYYSAGGFNNGLYIVSNDSKWTVDTPESPHSILAILMRAVRTFSTEDRLDLRNVEVSFALRANGLDLHGANTYFWIGCHEPVATRWHITANPLKIVEGEWTNQNVQLVNDETKWHCSWSKQPPPSSLDATLSGVSSYGFAFTDFEQPVSGQIELSAFSIHKHFNSIVPP